jgi:hypothetical protein
LPVGHICACIQTGACSIHRNHSILQKKEDWRLDNAANNNPSNHHKNKTDPKKKANKKYLKHLNGRAPTGGTIVGKDQMHPLGGVIEDVIHYSGAVVGTDVVIRR